MNKSGEPAEVKIPGYVLDADILKRIDNISQLAFENTDSDRQMRSTFLVTDLDNADSTFDSPDGLLTYLDSEAAKVQSISLKYVALDSGINIVFSQKNITLSHYGGKAGFQFDVDRLQRVIHECDPEYGLLVRILIFREWLKKSLGWSLLILSSLLLLLLAYYVYATKVGVNVDPTILPSGNAYFQDVEKAIKSADTNAKLNVLLQAQMRDFMNVRDVLRVLKWLITLPSVALVIVVAVSLIRWRLVRLYPVAFFAFGHQIQILGRLQRKREIWFTVIVIGFIVNVVAGLLVAISTR